MEKETYRNLSYIIIASLFVIGFLLWSPFALALEGANPIEPTPAELKNIEKIPQIFDKVKMVDMRISMHGTEYDVGDDGTVFLQLTKDFEPVLNSTCFITIFYPNKTVLLRDYIMSNIGDDGIYYYDMTIPDELGVYITSAKCYVPGLDYNITYNPTQTEDWESGDIYGGTGWSESQWSIYEPGVDVIDTQSPHNGTYHLKIKNADRYAHRGFNVVGDELNISVWIKIRALENDDEFYVQFWDGSYHTLRTFTAADSDDEYHHYLFNLNSSQYNIGSNIIRFIGCSMFGTADYAYIDGISVSTGTYEYYSINETEYQTVRGSGEIHVKPCLYESTWEEFWKRGTPPLLPSTQYYCKNNVTLVKNITYTYCEDHKCTDYSKVEDIKCTYGCFDGECAPSPLNVNIYALIIVLLLIFVLYIIYKVAHRR